MERSRFAALDHRGTVPGLDDPVAFRVTQLATRRAIPAHPTVGQLIDVAPICSRSNNQSAPLERWDLPRAVVVNKHWPS